jgi:hypothetical protein
MARLPDAGNVTTLMEALAKAMAERSTVLSGPSWAAYDVLRKQMAEGEAGQPPYPQEALDAAAAELARQRHGGPADPDDLLLASHVLNAAFAARAEGRP